MGPDGSKGSRGDRVSRGFARNTGSPRYSRLPRFAYRLHADYDASREREHLSPRIRGRPSVDDLAQCESELARQLARSGSLKLLCVLTGFEGWDPHLESHNLALYLKHGDQIARIAIVGDERRCGRP